MDPNQIISSGIDVYNSLPLSTQEAMLNPAAKTLGENENFKLNKCYLKLNSFGSSLCHCIFE